MRCIPSGGVITFTYHIIARTLLTRTSHTSKIFKIITTPTQFSTHLLSTHLFTVLYTMYKIGHTTQANAHTYTHKYIFQLSVITTYALSFSILHPKFLHPQIPSVSINSSNPFTYYPPSSLSPPLSFPLLPPYKI